MNENYRVQKLEQSVHWIVEVPGSKSITNRALLIAALTQGTVTLHGVLFSDDSRYFLQALIDLGYRVEIYEEEKRVVVEGHGASLPQREGEIYVGSAGTAARFLAAFLGVSEGTYRIQASAQMQKRPMKSLFEALIFLGAKIEWLGEPWHLPVQITGARSQSLQKDSPANLKLDISESTQFLSAFLLIAPMFQEGLKITITSQKKDGSYIRITRKMMQDFGVETYFDGSSYEVKAGSIYHRGCYQIEPDVSAACYFYGAAAITGGYCKVKHVHADVMQGDMKFLQVLEQMGCEIVEEADGISVTGPEKGHLKGITLNMNDFSDQALTLAALAPYAQSPVEIQNIGHIRGQESDRIHAIVSNLRASGIVCEEYEDGVKIYPGQIQPCQIETYEDHRVAMAFAIMGLGGDGIEILNPMCCRKTFENFFEVLDHLSQT